MLIKSLATIVKRKLYKHFLIYECGKLTFLLSFEIHMAIKTFGIALNMTTFYHS